MSLFHSEQFNVWFPAIVLGFLISLVVTALWDLIRRRFWLLLSKGSPSILKEVGLDRQYQSRAEAEDQYRQTIDKLNKIARGMNLPVSPKSPISGATTVVDIEAQTAINPHHATLVIHMSEPSAVDGVYSTNSSSENHAYPGETFQGVDCRPIINFTAYFPDGASKDVTRPAKKLCKRHANGRVKRMKSSIILQASMAIDAGVLVEIVELANYCLQKENRCVFQLGNWAILYYNAGEVQIHLFRESDVPVNVEARWQVGKVGIKMCGLYLTGSQIKVGTKKTSKILQSVGPATQGAGDLDELYLPTKESHNLEENSFIYASKAVVVDGVSLIARSEASFILPPREKSSLIEAIWIPWLWISSFAKKMLQSLLFGGEDYQLEPTTNCPELDLNPKQLELNVEHWKGLSEIELLNKRKEVLLHLQEQRASRIIKSVGPPSLHCHLNFVKDEHYLECWQEGLQVLNEVIHRNSNDSHSHTHIKVRGDIQFLLGDYESALQDYHLAHLNMGGHQSTILLERALVKCMLGRYVEAMEDVVVVLTLSPNANDIQELQASIQQLLDQQRSFQRVTESGSVCQQPLLIDREKDMVKIPDLLTRDEWHSGEIGSSCPVSDADIARHNTSSHLPVTMPVILKNRNNQVCWRLDKYCEECARIGGTDCIDHGGPMSVDSSLLGEHMGIFDGFDDFMQTFGRDDHKVGPFKPQSKRPTIPTSSRLFSNDKDNFLIPTPTRPASPSSFGMSSRAPNLSIPAPSSFGIQSPPKFVSPIKPAVFVPASAPSVIVAPSTEAATLKSHDTSDLCRDVRESAEKLDQDNDDIGCKEGGVRFRENLGKFVVEYRPPHFKWKLWMGTYATVDEGRRACDCARFYAGQDKGGFYFKDSPALFSELGPLNHPFSLVSKDLKDKAFNVELKKRAKQVIRKVLDAQRAKQPADVARPSVTIPLPNAIVQQVVLGARTANRDTSRDNSPSSNQGENPLSSGITDPTHEEDEVAEESAQQEVASAIDAGDPYANLDLFTNPGSFPEPSFDYLTGVFVPGFKMVPFPPSGCIQSSENFADDLVCDVELWHHEC